MAGTEPRFLRRSDVVLLVLGAAAVLFFFGLGLHLYG